MPPTHKPVAKPIPRPFNLPPLPNTSGAYLTLLLIMVVGFYILLVASLVIVAWLLYEMIVYTPAYLSHVRGGGALKLMLIAYGLVLFFGYALLKAIFTRVGGDPLGIRATRDEHPKVFALTDEVAQKVGAAPIDEIFLTPGNELGVWEEAALYQPPGTGKRKIVLGMGALNYLGVDHLRSILAHEYGHFSNKDTFFSRFIFRVSGGYAAIGQTLAGQKIQYINPLFWLIKGYAWVYHALAASFSRVREYAADRFAVEAYGQPLFLQALMAAHVEGTFFSQVGMKRAFELAQEGKGFRNIYHFVGSSRRMFQHDARADVDSVVKEMLEAKTGRFDSHPALADRLAQQGVKPGSLALPLPPRPLADPELDADLEEEKRQIVASGGPSAAEELLGEQTRKIQGDLSDLLSAQYIHMVNAMRQAQQAS
ncbi:MAG: M48 family metallopeptidase [Planctomycetota bacterium]|nr:M48 family metallopeptidase [Planctomycetota bacterium]